MQLNGEIRYLSILLCNPSGVTPRCKSSNLSMVFHPVQEKIQFREVLSRNSIESLMRIVTRFQTRNVWKSSSNTRENGRNERVFPAKNIFSFFYMKMPSLTFLLHFLLSEHFRIDFHVYHVKCNFCIKVISFIWNRL